MAAAATLAGLLLVSEAFSRGVAALAGLALVAGLLVCVAVLMLRAANRAQRPAPAPVQARRDRPAAAQAEAAPENQNGARRGNRMEERLRSSAKRQRRDLAHTYLQLEALDQVIAALKPSLPLPAARGWAMSPDMIRVVIRLISQNPPDLIVETGSGLSTLCFAYALRRAGSTGRIVSLDHDADYGGRTRTLLAEHGLDDIAEVRIAPLTPQTVAGETWSWYEPSALEDLGQISLLIVDGPPGTDAEQARWPALPLLRERLAADAVIMLDDGNRTDETAIGARWAAELIGSELRTLETEKGTIVIGPPERLTGIYL